MTKTKSFPGKKKKKRLIVLFKIFEKAEPENVLECMWPMGKVLFHIVSLEKEKMCQMY